MRIVVRDIHIGLPIVKITNCYISTLNFESAPKNQIKELNGKEVNK